MSAGEILAVRQIEKRYGGVRALRGVSFGVCAGEVHALVGENGAGKSTLTKILGGSVEPDAGEFVLDGQSSRYGGLAAAKAFGIETVQQELELALPLSAAENIFLGILPAQRGFVRRRECVARAGEILRSLGASFDPAALVRDLSVPDRQVVEIARALARKSRILLLDEPTAALSQVEAARLLDRVGSLCGQGVGIVYISHRLATVGNYVVLPNFYYRAGRDTFFGSDVLEAGSAEPVRMRAIRTKMTIPPVMGDLADILSFVDGQEAARPVGTPSARPA